MNYYHEVNVSEREAALHYDSNSSITNETQDVHSASPSYTSCPHPATGPLDRNDSAQSAEEIKCEQLDAEYAQYTDAPPPYSEKQYAGKSEEQQNTMRMKDYTKEIKRQMGKQLVRDLKSGDMKTEPFEHIA